MDYDRLAVYCDLTPEKAIEVDLQTIANYLAFLFRIARTGGPTTEEEIFVENLAASLDVPSEVLRKAVDQSQCSDEKILTAAAKLKNTPLRECAFLDACQLTRLDREISADEQFALKEAERGLDLSPSLAEKTKRLAAGHDRLLHVFCLLVDRPDPADLWAFYMLEGLRQSDRQRRIILPEPERTSKQERIHVLALAHKLVGLGWRRSAKESIVQNLYRFLNLSPDEHEASLKEAWDLKTSLEGLTSLIQTRPLQLIAISDAHRICLSDTHICQFEERLLHDLTRQLSLEPSLIDQLLELTYREVAFRESVQSICNNSDLK
ncbi:MAG: hypothetical protein ACFE0O_04430 [Opitutales bacterium]